MDEQDFETLEKAFWFGDAAFYRARLTPDCLMIFPGMGIVDRGTLIAGIEQGQRWSHVSFHDMRTQAPRDGVAILAYRAFAMRDDLPQPWLVDCASVYVAGDDGWQLAFHQQTPVTLAPAAGPH